MKIQLHDDDILDEVLPTEYCLLEWYRTNAYEKWIKDNVKDKTFIDLGAGSGILCYQALYYGAKKVYAYEGNKHCINKLEKLFGDVDRVEILHRNWERDPIPKCDVYVHEMIAHNVVHEGLLVLFARAKYEGFADTLTPFDIQIWNCVSESYDRIEEDIDKDLFEPATKDFILNIAPEYKDIKMYGHLHHVKLKEELFHGHMKDLDISMFVKPEYAGTENRIAWKVTFPDGSFYQNFNCETHWSLGQYFESDPRFSYDPEENIALSKI